MEINWVKDSRRKDPGWLGEERRKTFVVDSGWYLKKSMEGLSQERGLGHGNKNDEGF